MAENINYTPPEGSFVVPFAADENLPYIFISYAHDDRERVFPIITRLYEQGWRIWYDEGIPPSVNYNSVIASHINGCALFLMFVTQTACERQYVIENEVEYAIRKKRREQIMLCFLEDDIVMPPAADMQLGSVAKPKYQSVKGRDLERVLSGVDGLHKGEPRKAKGLKVGNDSVVADDDSGEYSFETCAGGVRLTKYLGRDTDVMIPAEYPAGSGQRVVELSRTFYDNRNVCTVRLPTSVKVVKRETFSGCNSLKDVYIPSSAAYFSFVGIESSCTIHCAKDFQALEYVKENGMPYVIDNSLAIYDQPDAAYAYISYSSDMQERATEIIDALKSFNCAVIDGSKLSGMEVMKDVRECACFVAFVSRSYLAGEDIEILRTASALNKPKLIYVLEACELPSDMSIESESLQQLRYDWLDEKQRTAKLVGWLQENGCRRASADIPDFDYTATTKGGITLTNYTGSGGDVIIPNEHGGLPVTGIGDGAFRGCSNLTGVTIPDSVEYIGDSAFSHCSHLTRITIPDSIERIGDTSFCNCSRLTDITIPDSVTVIGASAFRDCSRLKDIAIPGNVKSVGASAFWGCRRLAAVTVHNGVKNIGDKAFAHCPNLTSITIPASVVSICDEAVDTCLSLTVCCPEGSYAWKYCERKGIRHEPLAAAESAEVLTEAVRKSVPRKKSPARWLVPVLILLAIAAAAGLQVSGLVDILGMLGV